MTSHDPRKMLTFLEKLQARSYLSSDEQQAFVNLPFEEIELKPNRDIARQGEKVTHSCFVAQGAVGYFKQGRHGTRQIVSIFIEGDMVGLHSAMIPDALAALGSLMPTTILRVPHSAVRQVARDHPNLAEAFWRHCVVDAGILMEWVANVGRREAKVRLAHFICELAWRAATDDEPKDGMVIPYPITQFQLSEILSLTPVHINRILQALRQEALIETIDRSLQRVLSWRRLASVGDFDPHYLHLGDVSAAQAA